MEVTIYKGKTYEFGDELQNNLVALKEKDRQKWCINKSVFLKGANRKRFLATLGPASFIDLKCLFGPSIMPPLEPLLRKNGQPKRPRAKKEKNPKPAEDDGTSDSDEELPEPADSPVEAESVKPVEPVDENHQSLRDFLR